MLDPAPLKDAATVGTVDGVDEKTEGGEPSGADHKIRWIVDEAAGKRKQPEQREHNGQCGDDFGVDEAGFRKVGVRVVIIVEVFADQTTDDLKREVRHV